MLREHLTELSRNRWPTRGAHDVGGFPSEDLMDEAPRVRQRRAWPLDVEEIPNSRAVRRRLPCRHEAKLVEHGAGDDQADGLHVIEPDQLGFVDLAHGAQLALGHR